MRNLITDKPLFGVWGASSNAIWYRHDLALARKLPTGGCLLILDARSVAPHFLLDVTSSIRISCWLRPKGLWPH